MTKPVIVTRAGKGSALTWTEGDSNLTNLRDATIGITDGTNSGTLDLNDQLTVSASGSATVNYNNSTKTLTIGASSSVPTHLTNGSYELALNTDGTVTVPTSSVSGTPARIQSESGKNLQLNAGGSIFTLGYDGTLATPYNVKLTTSGIQFSDSSTQTTAFTGHVSWSNVDSKPSFANVAETGNYNDLTNKPTIPVLPSNAAGVLTNDGSGTLSWAAASGGGGGPQVAIYGAIGQLTISSNTTYGGVTTLPGTLYSPMWGYNWGTAFNQFDPHGLVTINSSNHGIFQINSAGTYLIEITGLGGNSSNNDGARTRFVDIANSTYVVDESGTMATNATAYGSNGGWGPLPDISVIVTVASSGSFYYGVNNSFSGWKGVKYLKVTKLA